MEISQAELLALESDVDNFYEYFKQFRRENNSQASPQEFRNVIKRLDELVVVSRNIEAESKRRAF